VELIEGGQWICLSISDTGTGIPPEVKPHLFEPFFTTKPRGEGTGLGLAQVHGIVTQHGGSIRMETEIDRGTTFRIYLPCYELQEVEEVEEIPQEEALPLRSNGQKETILLVEDEEKLRRLGCRALEGLGYRVLTAVNGRDALQVYHSAEDVDLVLTDMVMPEMGGRDLMRELRKVTPHLKGLVITGYALKDDLRALREEGILEVVQKPFDIEALGEVVRQVLDSD
jgi:two-component system cell cycle sensor histidine kinase/response regulator CckA